MAHTNENAQRQTGKNHSVYQPNTNGVLNKPYVDYFAERNNKFNNLIEKNFDDGQSFYRNYEKYQGEKMLRNLTHAQILKAQMKIKQDKKLE